MSSSRLLQGGPQCNRERTGVDPSTEEVVRRQGRARSDAATSQSRRRREGFCPGPSRKESHPASTFILNLWPPDCETTNFCCLKPHSLRCFIMAAPGDGAAALGKWPNCHHHAVSRMQRLRLRETPRHRREVAHVRLACRGREGGAVTACSRRSISAP